MKTYLPHQQRVITEMLELDERTTKLAAFLKSETFQGLSERERELLTEQRVKQRELLAVLNQRVALFTPVEVEDAQKELDFGKKPAVEQVPEETLAEHEARKQQEFEDLEKGTDADPEKLLGETPTEQSDL